jgi:hypothetical protein
MSFKYFVIPNQILTQNTKSLCYHYPRNQTNKEIPMKLSIVLLSLLTAQLSFANCLGEAQIIAQVSSIKSKSLSHCTVDIDVDSVKQYNVNMTCPLDLSAVLVAGVDVGLKNGHDCAMDAGDEITGVLVLNKAGKIILE